VWGHQLVSLRFALTPPLSSSTAWSRTPLAEGGSMTIAYAPQIGGRRLILVRHCWWRCPAVGNYSWWPSTHPVVHVCGHPTSWSLWVLLLGRQLGAPRYAPRIGWIYSSGSP
jgi:hypothetical protein